MGNQYKRPKIPKCMSQSEAFRAVKLIHQIEANLNCGYFKESTSFIHPVERFHSVSED